MFNHIQNPIHNRPIFALPMSVACQNDIYFHVELLLKICLQKEMVENKTMSNIKLLSFMDISVSVNLMTLSSNIRQEADLNPLKKNYCTDC